jgi:hypothetical protein
MDYIIRSMSCRELSFEERVAQGLSEDLVKRSFLVTEPPTLIYCTEIEHRAMIVSLSELILINCAYEIRGDSTLQILRWRLSAKISRGRQVIPKALCSKPGISHKQITPAEM